MSGFIVKLQPYRAQNNFGLKAENDYAHIFCSAKFISMIIKGYSFLTSCTLGNGSTLDIIRCAAKYFQVVQRLNI